MPAVVQGASAPFRFRDAKTGRRPRFCRGPAEPRFNEREQEGNAALAATAQITVKSLAVSVGWPCSVANSIAAPAPLPSASKYSWPVALL